MDQEELKRYFEVAYLKGTCFDSFEDLMKDETSMQINAPKAFIAVELRGVWRGLNDKIARR